MVTVGEITGFIERLAPLALAEPWDRVGLQIGRLTMGVSELMVCLDVTDAVLDEALAQGCQMIIVHHPLLFSDFAGLTESTTAGRLALRAAEEGLAVYVAHTNLDKAPGGISDSLAARFGLVDVEVLQADSTLLKLVVFLPKAAVDRVKTAIGDAGAGTIGLYSHCSFSSAGTGSFRPLAGAHPSEGEVGKDNQIEEYRLEVEVSRPDLGDVIGAMLSAHPYEEVAYDIYELKNVDKRRGLGRVGNVKPELAFDAFIDVCVKAFGNQVRYAGRTEPVRRVAVCGGSGGSVVAAAGLAGADVLVTGDIKYHDAQKAVDMGLAVVDAAHDVTEVIGMQELSQRISREFDLKVFAPGSIGSIWQGV